MELKLSFNLTILANIFLHQLPIVLHILTTSSIPLQILFPVCNKNPRTNCIDSGLNLRKLVFYGALHYQLSQTVLNMMGEQ